jgi:hypothetical protein
MRLCDLPFNRTENLKNSLSDNQPVKMSRDTQELAQDVGMALCMLCDKEKQFRVDLVEPAFMTANNTDQYIINGKMNNSVWNMYPPKGNSQALENNINNSLSFEEDKKRQEAYESLNIYKKYSDSYDNKRDSIIIVILCIFRII